MFDNRKFELPELTAEKDVPSDESSNEPMEAHGLGLHAEPAALISEIKGFFGEVGVESVSNLDSRIPDCLRQTEEKRVLAIRCQEGLSAIILKDPRYLVVSEAPRLQRTPLTMWAGKYICWIRFDPAGIPKQNVELNDAAWCIVEGLIPVSDDRPDAEAFVIRGGTTAPLQFDDLVKQLQAIDVASEIGSQENAPKTQSANDAGSAADPEKAPRAQETVNRLIAVFGEERILRNVGPDDPRVPAQLRPIPSDNPSAGRQQSCNGVLAVQCGPGSTGHLVGIVFFEPKHAQKFKDDNLELYSVVTLWNSCAIAWVKIDGYVPQNFPFPEFSWISEGAIPVAAENAALIGALAAEPIVPTTRLHNIIWESEKVRHYFEVDEIQRSFGKPFLTWEAPALAFNDLFFSELLVKRLGLVYDTVQESFQRYNGTTATWFPVRLAELERIVANNLIGFARQYPTEVRPAMVTKGKVNHLIWLMQIRASAHLPTEEEALDRFCEEAVERAESAQLTQDEFYGGLKRFCQLRKLPLCSRAYFDRAATKRFGKTSHGLGPERTSRGRVGWRLKEDAIRGISASSSAAGRDP
jgi:hypothetical protein